MKLRIRDQVLQRNLQLSTIDHTKNFNNEKNNQNLVEKHKRVKSHIIGIQGQNQAIISNFKQQNRNKINKLNSQKSLDTNSIVLKDPNMKKELKKPQESEVKQKLKTLSKNIHKNKTLSSNNNEPSQILIIQQKQLSNVNSFKHLLSVPTIDYQNIKWTVTLRNHQKYKQLPRSNSQIPSTYYKATQASKIHHQIAQIASHLNFNDFHHIANHEKNSSLETLKFSASLRQSQNKSPQLLKKQKQFLTVPLKEKLQYPKLLKSTSIKKKTINPQEDQNTAFDGDQNFPSYTNQIIKEKNYNNLREIIKKQSRGKINLPSIGWQSNLRFYEQLKKDKNEYKSQNKIKK